MVVQKKTEPASVYQLKVTLKDIEPPIWRRILVKGDATLFKLHRIIQLAMGWEDYHLHEFVVGEECYAVPSPEDPWPMETKNEKRAKLSKVAPAEMARFVYEYDLGDSWRHEILVEKIFQPEKDLAHPVCVDGKRSAPPEDCGGTGGYDEFLEIITDPKHPDRDDMLRWAGEDFDPERFDKNTVNRHLRRMK